MRYLCRSNNGHSQPPDDLLGQVDFFGPRVSDLPIRTGYKAPAHAEEAGAARSF